MAIKISPYGPISEFLSDLEDAEGKTIQSINDECPAYQDHKIFRFTDGTALALYQTDDGGYSENPSTFDGNYNAAERAYFGQISAEEWEAKVQADNEKRRMETEVVERATLAKLKAKYPTP